MKNAFVGLISWVDTDEERISELGRQSRNFPSWNVNEKKRKLLEHPKMSKDITGIPEEEENKNRKEIFEVMTSEEDLKLMIVTKS